MKMLRIAGLMMLTCASAAQAQWNPALGQWGKSDNRDLRVMTWNVQDCLCRTDGKAEGLNSWCAVARIVAAMQPDVLIMQECGDNSGNGTGSGVDSVSQLTTTLELFLRGGSDPFKGGVAVGAYVQKYAPSYDLPYIYVSDQDDGFNRNVVLSRYPFTDLNGDTRTARSQPVVLTDLYAPGGTGGIRGFIFAEIDLPNESYAGDLVMGCAHLRSGSQASDLAERLTASRNVAYYVDYLFNGGGTLTPDPRAKIVDSPAATTILSPDTPVIMGGDWNEDELSNGRDGPALWLTRAQTAGAGSDGTDRDRSDCLYDDARDVFAAGDRSTQSSSKLDYLAWQDSIATLRRAWIFKSSTIPGGSYPPELLGFPGTPGLVTGAASDHRPVLADFVLPEPTVIAPGAFGLLTPADGSINVELTPTLTWEDSSDAETYTVTIAEDAALTSVIHTSAPLSAATASYAAPASVLAECATYYWGVTAVNPAGSQGSTPQAFAFSTIRPADLNGDGFVDFADYLEFLNLYDAGDLRVDFNQDGFVDFADYLEFLNRYEAGC